MPSSMVPLPTLSFGFHLGPPTYWRPLASAASMSSISKGARNPSEPPDSDKIGGAAPWKMLLACMSRPSPPIVTTRSTGDEEEEEEEEEEEVAAVAAGVSASDTSDVESEDSKEKDDEAVEEADSLSV